MKEEISLILNESTDNYDKWERIVELLQGLPPEEKSDEEKLLENRLWLLWQLNSQISNGGVSQLFVNIDLVEIESMISALNEINAQEMVEIIQEMLSHVKPYLDEGQDPSNGDFWNYAEIMQKDEELTAKVYDNPVQLEDTVIEYLDSLALRQN